MYTIIISFIVVIIVGISLIKSSINEELKPTILEFILFLGILLGVFSPLSGFNNAIQVQEIRLIPFTPAETYLLDDSQDIFIQISENTVSYKYVVERIIREDEEDLSFDIVTKTIKGNIKIQESADCTIPVLKVYKKSGKSSSWTFALFCEKKEYVFYIPAGSKQYLD